jgi:hypothetical protein
MIDPDLLRAYKKTRFVVRAPEGEIVLRVGERNLHLDALMAKFSAVSSAFVTAWNPGSVSLSVDENQNRQTTLTVEVEKAGYVSFCGEGVGQDQTWAPEASVLIVGILRGDAQRLGMRFGQVAIVFAERGRALELLLCSDHNRGKSFTT